MSSLRLTGLVGWLAGSPPEQARFVPGVNAGFLRGYGPVSQRADRLILLTAMLQRPLLRSTPFHALMPVHGQVFFDIALPWNRDQELGSLRLDEAEKSWGLGLSYSYQSVQVAFPTDGPLKKARVYVSLVLIE
jgi:hemolysin activation/secretion protein